MWRAPINGSSGLAARLPIVTGKELNSFLSLGAAVPRSSSPLAARS